jgi:hypothetical protein
MKKFVSILAFSVSLTAIVGCQQKKIEKQELQYKRVLETSDFSKIEAEGRINIRIKQGEKNEVILVSANKDRIPYFSWTVKNGNLILEYDPPLLIFPSTEKSNNETFIVFITVKNLQSISLEDQAMAMVGNSLLGDSLKIELSDLSKLFFKGTYNYVGLSMEDVTKCTLEGTFKNIKASLEDNADWDASKARIQVLNLNTSEIAKADVFATEKLVVSAADLSRVVYSGAPQTEDLNTADGAKIIKK